MRSISSSVPSDPASHLITRRGFLGKLGAGTVATLALLRELRADKRVAILPPTTKALGTPLVAEDLLTAEEPFFADFAKVFTISNEHKYLVASQKGSMPIPILQHFKEGLDQIARDPFPVYLEPSESTRRKIAKGYGARLDEIAISRNTTDAISQILQGLDWQAGDEILCSTLEYPNCVATILRVAGRFRLTVRQFGVPSRPDFSAEEIVDSARRQITPGKTRAMFFSCPAHPNGVAMPVRRLARLAQEHGVITVVDGAHYGGMLVPHLDETGIDFWGISGHKWQCGPGGTGILYARNDSGPANPMPLPRFHIVRSGDLDAPTDGSRPAGFDLGAALSLYGFPESADWRALGEACEFWDQIGRDRIQNYIIALADHTRVRLVAVFGEAAILQPCKDVELRSGIVAFNPFPRPEQRRDPKLAHEFQARLIKEFGYHVGCGGTGQKGLTRSPSPEAAAFFDSCIPNRDPETNQPAPDDIPFRTGTPAWCNRTDMDDFVAACGDLVKKMGG
jgi:isopenicillin-N epimerase